MRQIAVNKSSLDFVCRVFGQAMYFEYVQMTLTTKRIDHRFITDYYVNEIDFSFPTIAYEDLNT